MSDDEWGDLLDVLDEPTEKSTASIKSSSEKKPPNSSKSSGLASILSSQDSKLLSSTKKGVNFSISTSDNEHNMRAAGRSTNALNDLFGTPSGGSSAPPRRAGGPSSLDDLFGTPSKPSVPSASTAPQPETTQVAQPTSAVAAQRDNFEAGRILRLETELDRVNRELEDTKRKKREDEEDLENFWKAKLEAQSKDSIKTVDDLKNSHKVQLEKLQQEHHSELARIKTNFDRQLENVTSSTSQVGDLVAVVRKVDNISNNIDRIAADVVATTNKVSYEQTALLQLQEERLKMKEEKLAEDTSAFRAEQLKVHELNLSLKDLVKHQQDAIEKEKWRTKEEWNRLKVERQLFKENQEIIIGNIEREKQNLSEEMRNFRKNQNDLLFRVSTERELLEQEKAEFFAKRDQDIKRIKAEAYELDLKSQQVSTADHHVTEMKLVTEAKFRQLQQLETLLSAECSEIERMRNEQKMNNLAQSAMHLNLGESERRQRRSRGEEDVFGSNNSNQNSQRRSESVRASLKKHYENLEKYAGQKVATVAPQNN
ncbi:hypothetical protein L5515_009951 [Caenorhabditis briggsae]|uniref:Fas-binding factor 1 C-terminal domain-containing protein n=1 Tax=Caenorhabditis briggsae TaxID=6238 RepID=A0AAE9ABQ6_CAEBR|nr:hypothetical protein L3Y34_010150 [Caenorhabditis briggsae]UMM38607.1 hypothetical protein L5515_009951 [Caenorhabditis briggsae]